MPIYEFQCPDCGFRFDKLCRMGEQGDNVVCSQCGHAGAQKLLSVFATAGGSSSDSGPAPIGGGGG